MEGGTYSVETRTTRDDYDEQHEDFNSPEEVKAYIKGLEEDEHVHSVLFYAEGTTCNPKDVTRNFK